MDTFKKIAVAVGQFILSYLAAFLIWVILDIVWLVMAGYEFGTGKAESQDIPAIGLWELLTAIGIFVYWRRKQSKEAASEQKG